MVFGIFVFNQQSMKCLTRRCVLFGLHIFFVLFSIPDFVCF